jgi:acetylornithine deacetylase/succinyl-diaminopimelate desuccinylase-like protein
VELGPTNASIHMVDESIGLDELAPLARIYRRIIEALT